jgi:hypothetical protein
VNLRRGVLDQAAGTPGKGHVSKVDQRGVATDCGGRAF